VAFLIAFISTTFPTTFYTFLVSSVISNCRIRKYLFYLYPVGHWPHWVATDVSGTGFTSESFELENICFTFTQLDTDHIELRPTFRGLALLLNLPMLCSTTNTVASFNKHKFFQSKSSIALFAYVWQASCSTCVQRLLCLWWNYKLPPAARNATVWVLQHRIWRGG
jgi:hypothetical protein